MSVPTKTAQMREAILVALAHPDLLGEGGAYTPELQFYVESRFNDNNTYVDWDMRGVHGKAFDRAREGLIADGLIEHDDFGYRLAVQRPEPTS